MSTADAILSRVTGIRRTGGSTWLARCPAHEDRSPSLSIRETREGVTLVHCFAGCHTIDVLAAVGLDWADLYPREPDSATPRSRPWAERYSATDMLEIVSEEVTLVAIIAADLLARRSISPEEWQRLAHAVGRIQRVRDHRADKRA